MRCGRQNNTCKVDILDNCAVDKAIEYDIVDIRLHRGYRKHRTVGGQPSRPPVREPMGDEISSKCTGSTLSSERIIASVVWKSNFLVRMPTNAKKRYLGRPGDSGPTPPPLWTRRASESESFHVGKGQKLHMKGH